MKIFFCSLFIVLVIASCKSKSNATTEKSIAGTWHLYDIEQLESKGDDAFSRNARLKKTVKEGAILCLFEDGTYSDVKGNGAFKTGKWKLSQENKSISFIDSGRALVPVTMDVEKKPNGKQVLTLFFEERNMAYKFVKESESLKDISSDPFYGSNNQWRIKPKQSEDSIALTRRLTNYLK